ncbi:NAC domain-containing protein 67-like [Salvia miltiorrhiza]|uniref:NAC domain-containing protein 67-like n=1 Tax=Salvia miltiorrhiza TaxID=226208 RepID=UPI0025ACE73D|nr:NAC domain-containing protein 67-like [Salvia miltiorrhiza]
MLYSLSLYIYLLIEKKIDEIFTNYNIYIVKMMKECGSSSSSSSSSSIGDHLLPGYRFVPTDYELLIHLHYKINHGVALTPHIRDVRLYDFHPQALTETYPAVGDNEWYFFTPRNRKHPKGFRPDRVAGGGFWRATATVKKVKHEGRVIGQKQTLVYHTGINKQSEKTSWMMHEYTAHRDHPTAITRANRATLDEWVLCRVYEKTTKVKGMDRQEDVVETQIHDQQFANSMIHAWGQINQQDFPSHPLLPAQQFNNVNIGGDAAAAAAPNMHEQDLFSLINGSEAMQGTPMSPQDYVQTVDDHNISDVDVNAGAGVEQLCNGNNAVVQRNHEDEMKRVYEDARFSSHRLLS